MVDQVNDDGSLNIRWDYPDGGPAVSRVLRSEVQRYTPPKRIAELVPGSTHNGTVVEITSYGAFVDIGATRDGLVHISCLKDGFVENIEDELELGQEVVASCRQVMDLLGIAVARASFFLVSGDSYFMVL